MADLLDGALILLLLSVAGGLMRVGLGPAPADRIMGAQLAGTGGIAMLLLLAVQMDRRAILDVAILFALLGAFASVAFVKSLGPDGTGDPEEDP